MWILRTKLITLSITACHVTGTLLIFSQNFCDTPIVFVCFFFFVFVFVFNYNWQTMFVLILVRFPISSDPVISLFWTCSCICCSLVCVQANSLQLCFCWTFSVLWTVACQAPLSMGFYRQWYWSGLSCPPPGDLPDPRMEPLSVKPPELAGRFFTTSATWEIHVVHHSIGIWELPKGRRDNICIFAK